MTDGEIVIDLSLALRNYTRNVDAARKSSERTDDAIQDMADSAKAADKEMNKLGKGVKVTINVEDSELRAAKSDVQDLDTPVSVTINVSGDNVVTGVKNDLNTIEAADPDIKFSVQGEDTVDNIKADLDTIDAADPNIDIDVDQNGVADIIEVRDYLRTISTMSKINFIISGAKAARNAIASIVDLPIVSTIGETNAALRTFQSLTGAPATGFIKDVITGEFTRGLAESPDQIARIAAQLEQAGLGGASLAGSLQSVYDFATVSQKPVEDITARAIQLVQLGQASDISSALDAITAGFVNGADGANDLLDALSEFAPSMSGIGLDAAQSIEFFNQALKNGSQNASRAGEIFVDLKNNLTTSLEAGAGNAQFDALDALGLTDLAADVASGKASGAELGQAVVDGIKDGLDAEGNAIDPDTLLTAIFGSSVTTLGTEVFKGIDFGAVIAAQIDPTATETAVEPLRNSFVSAAQELGRVLETEIADKFRIAGLPLQKILDDAPKKMRELAELIRGGEGIPEALEIVLEAPGLADTIHDFETGFNQAIIGFLAGLADLIAIIPGANPEPLRATVANLAAGQLTYDLVNADSLTDVQTAVQTAVDRGVSESQIFDSLEGATTEIISDDQLIRAQTLLNQFKEVAPIILPPAPDDGGGFGLDSREQILRGKTPEELAQARAMGIPIPSFFDDLSSIEDAQTAIDNAKLSLDDFAVAFAGMLGQNPDDLLDKATLTQEQIQKLHDNSTTAAPRVDALGASMTELTTDTDAGTLSFDALNTAVGEGAPTALDNLSNAYATNAPVTITWMDELITKYGELQQAAFDAHNAMGDDYQGGGNGGGGSGEYNPGNTPGLASGGMPTPGVPTWVGEGGRELLTFAPGASILNNATSEAIMSGLAALLGGGFGVGGQNVYNANMNVIINTQSNAGASAAGDRVGKTMRGFMG